MTWQERKDKCTEHVFSFANSKAALSGFAKWDGCVELKVHYNGNSTDNEDNPDDVDSIHICNLQNFIKELQELEVDCKSYFSERFEEWDY